jgi:hypothetical protein
VCDERVVASISLDEALSRILGSMDGGDPAKELAKIGKEADLKRALAPIAPVVKAAARVDVVLQRCLETGPGEPLRAAAEAFLASGAWNKPVLVSLAALSGAGPQPERHVAALLPSARGKNRGRIVYAGETKGTVSLWSSETGAHLEDWKAGKSRVCAIFEIDDAGTLRVLDEAGDVHERAMSDKAFAKVWSVGERDTFTCQDPRFVVMRGKGRNARAGGIPHDTVRVFDLDARVLRHEVALSFHRMGCLRLAGELGVVIAEGVRYVYADGREMKEERVDVVRLDDGTHQSLAITGSKAVAGIWVDGSDVLMYLHPRDDLGVRPFETYRFDPATLALTPYQRPMKRNAVGDGVYAYDTALFDEEGRLIADYKNFDESSLNETVFDPVNRRTLLAGGPLPVMMLVPYRPPVG